MGKKVKEDKKGPPEDVFDSLLVESRQAATVVLMLESPEDEVLAKACESIYKFADKCEENKKTLLDLKTQDYLLKLIKHEERVVRRNAMMALGIMAGHPEVRRSLRKNPDAVPSFITLLAPEEDTVVHEFAALALSYMALDYSTKVYIHNQDGVEALVRCLSSSDPDVQKNAIETLCHMLQDYQTKTALREVNAFPPLLDLIRSDYPVIQHLSLVSLERATQDAENRAALREQEAVNKFIDFIGKPEWNDLHVFAVMVLSNLLEDAESMEIIKENGGLQKLVAFITDTQPPEDEDTKGKKGKGDKAASRSGKKGKGGDDDGKDKSKSEVDPIIPTLPEVKEHAAKAIARAAKNADNRKLLHEQEVEKMLIALLDHDDANVQVSAAQGLGVMSENLLSRESIGQWEGIQPLIKMFKNDNADVREAASMALANLTTSNMANCHEVVNFNGIIPLINLLADSREVVIANSAIVLTNMATDEGMRSSIQQAGVVNALIEPLSCGNPVVEHRCSMAVAAFVGDAEYRAVFRENNGIEPLVALLKSGNHDVRRSASWAISICALDEPTASEIARCGGLEILQEIQQSESRKNAFTDVAVDKLLDNNLAAKYALTGFLSPNNQITDGFFDPGAVKPNAQFGTLEDFCTAEVNQKRPVLLINAKPEKPQTPVPQPSEVDVTDKASKSSVGGRNSRTGRDKAKSRAAREKEEKQKEEEAQKEAESAAAAGEPLPFTPPGDNNLCKYIEEVTEKIMPLPTCRAQVIALAQYVAHKMGGRIDRGQVANFSWELPISQLKFDIKSNVIPIGMIKNGIHYHRALLFKALADRIAVSTSLIRGEYNRAWNEVMLADDDGDYEYVDYLETFRSISTDEYADEPISMEDGEGASDGKTPSQPTTPVPSKPQKAAALKFPPKAYIVDLIHNPGTLMKSDSLDAVNYQKL